MPRPAPSVRPALLPPPLEPLRLARLTALGDAIIDAIDRGDPERFRRLDEFNAAAGTSLRLVDFHGAAGAMPTRDFVAIALTPKPGAVALSDDEAIALTEWLMTAPGERETDFLLELLGVSLGVGRAAFSDLVYWPARELTAAEIVRIVRTARGAALDAYLHPSCRGHAEPAPQDDARNASAPDPGASREAMQAARAVLERLVQARAIAVEMNAAPLDEIAARLASCFTHGGPPDAARVAEALLAEDALDVLVDDDDLAALLRASG